MNAYSVRGPGEAPENVAEPWKGSWTSKPWPEIATPKRQSSVVAPPGAVIVAWARTVANAFSPRVSSSSGPAGEIGPAADDEVEPDPSTRANETSPSFGGVTEPSASFAVLTAASASFASATDASARSKDFTRPSLILRERIALRATSFLRTERFLICFARTALRAISREVTLPAGRLRAA